MENTALRERLHLREQELEEARARLRSSQAAPTGDGELRQRLEGAEERASQMAREMKRIETELDDTTTRLHMSRLTDALREAGHVDRTEEQDSPSDRGGPVAVDERTRGSVVSRRWPTRSR